MSANPSVFTATVRVEPPTALNLNGRPLWEFTLTSVANDTLEAKSTHPDAEKLLQDERMLDELRHLAWDLLWEKMVAVEFEPSLTGKRVQLDASGRQLIAMGFESRMLSDPPNPRAGLKNNANFDLLQRIRDHVISVHLAGGDASRTTKLMANAAVLLAVEHFIKGVVNSAYSMVEYYLVAETIWNQLGGRHKLDAIHGKAVVDKITRHANEGQLDQRHAPKNLGAVAPVPANVVADAATVAKGVIIDFAKRVI